MSLVNDFDAIFKGDSPPKRWTPLKKLPTHKPPPINRPMSSTNTNLDSLMPRSLMNDMKEEVTTCNQPVQKDEDD
jgi:hypothetical protein